MSTPHDTPVSAKELGCILGRSETTFRLYAPRATCVTLVLYDRVDATRGEPIAMTIGADGVWEHRSAGRLIGKCYGYQVAGSAGPDSMFDPAVVVADPYARAVATRNHYRQQARSLILDPSYDWEGDAHVAPKDHATLVIYEAHLRDLTADPSSRVKKRGTYAGLCEAGKAGGLSHLVSLGVNAVEFLPLQKSGVFEIPYRDDRTVDDNGEHNTWNPYERNHWGYMTSSFFAPESRYASDGSDEPGALSGAKGRAVTEFKDLVKALHRTGIAVIMDVVYNHASQYDYNPLKYADKAAYFRLDGNGRFLNRSGCGNDLRTEHPMTRRLILDSVRHWMTEYHVDGFRFDLAAMIDPETRRRIIEEARALYPGVIIIAEPWGGGAYEPGAFSDLGWSSWNDRFRNAIKGEHPARDRGFLFGRYRAGESRATVEASLAGSLRADGGEFRASDQSVNYLESHDGYTLGDFIRIATGAAREGERIADRRANARLSERQLSLHRLAAMALLTSRGPVMLHEGQEFGRSKVIDACGVPDERDGMLDDNSYNKDNRTNHLDYGECALNRPLVDYYRGLIAIRRAFPSLARAPRAATTFLETGNELCIAMRIHERGAPALLVILNANPDKPGSITLPRGPWTVLADAESASPDGLGAPVRGLLAVGPVSGMILAQP
jgi:pullulanase/glycogen debranching enzyme